MIFKEKEIDKRSYRKGFIDGLSKFSEIMIDLTVKDSEEMIKMLKEIKNIEYWEE